jgi:hypothetical protein
MMPPSPAGVRALQPAAARLQRTSTVGTVQRLLRSIEARRANWDETPLFDD